MTPWMPQKEITFMCQNTQECHVRFIKKKLELTTIVVFMRVILTTRADALCGQITAHLNSNR